MPHIVVEHTKRLMDEPTHAAFLKALHERVAAEPSVDIKRIKTRSIPLEDAIVGDDSMEDWMIHIALKLMSGRSAELRKSIALDLQKIARDFLERSGKHTCAVTVEIVELDPQTYCA
jgi:5-carboxymethyl-2-hydroxymuconate isomerase